LNYFRFNFGGLFAAHFEQGGDFIEDVDDVGRFIALAAVGNRCQVGRVCLDQDALAGNRRQAVAQHLGIFEGDDPRVGDVGPELDEFFGPVVVTGVAMDDEGLFAFKSILDDIVDVFEGVAAVNDGGLAVFGRDFHEAAENAALFVEDLIFFVVVVIQTDFADGDNALVLVVREKSIVDFIEVAGMQRVNSGSAADAVFSGNGEIPFCILEVAGDQGHLFNAGLAGPADDGSGIVTVIEVEVCIVKFHGSRSVDFLQGHSAAFYRIQYFCRFKVHFRCEFNKILVTALEGGQDCRLIGIRSE